MKWMIICLACVFLGCVFGCRKDGGQPSRKADHGLRVYGSHRLDEPLKKIVADFQAHTGITVSSEFGCGVPKLIPDLKANQDGDVLVAGEAEELRLATESGLVASSRTIAWNPFVLVVKAGNPLGVKTPGDLSAARLTLPVPDSGCVSRLSDQIINAWNLTAAAGKAQRLDRGCKSALGCEMVAKGEADATFTWRIVAAPVAGIQMIPIEKAKGAPCECFGIILKNAKHPEAAKQFVDFLLAGKSQAIFCEAGILDVQERAK